MPEFTISRLTDFDISQDGKRVILNFGQQGERLALEITTLDLERVTFEIGSALVKARDLSGLSSQSIAQFLRPPKFRADLTTDNTTVVTIYQLPSGIEHRYGLEPNHAEALARQILDAVQRSRKTKPPQHH